MNTRKTNRGTPLATWGFGALLLISLAAPACDTPVYLYALQNWQRDSYQVYYFYREAIDPRDAEVNRTFDHLVEGLETHSNLKFSRTDVSRLESAKGPWIAQKLWTQHQADALPFYVILTPKGTELFAGSLDKDTVTALLESPHRTQLAQQLSQGKQGLLLVLQGPNQAENEAAEELVRQVIADNKKQKREVGFLTVARKDPQERWLVQQLLQVEDDLKELNQIMVFGVFGRGYVIPPYLGKGVTRANIAKLVEFMNGPCTCEIKAANPGLDLLTNWDWQAHIPKGPVYTETALNSLLFDVSAGPSRQRSAPASAGGPPSKAVSSPPIREERRASSSLQGSIGLPLKETKPVPSLAKGGSPVRNTSLPPVKVTPIPRAGRAGVPLPHNAALQDKATLSPSLSSPIRKEGIGKSRASSPKAEESPIRYVAGPPSGGISAEVMQGQATPSFTSLLAQRLGWALVAVLILVGGGSWVLLRKRKEA